MTSTIQGLTTTDLVTCPATTIVGIVALGDLAMEPNPNSAPGDIRAASPAA